MTTLLDLVCQRCGAHVPADRPQTLCPHDGGCLYARYDLEAARGMMPSPGAIASSPELCGTMWRYAAVMPAAAPVSLGEGQTPLFAAPRLSELCGAENLYLKDEGLNPTGSFKARGLSAAVSMLRQFGVRKIAIPTAGNAGGALAAYCAVTGIEAHIFAPRDVPRGNLAEYRAFGARLTLVDGLISDCARLVAEGSEREGWFDVSTMKEPWRVEGKKTMAYEAVEQLGRVPQAIIYPTGGGVGLLGMWKAFAEMQSLGWIGAERPRMVAVQAAGCAPVVRAFAAGAARTTAWESAATHAAGLRVPSPYAGDLILKVLRESGGMALAVGEAEIEQAARELGALAGVFAAPEAAAGWAGAKQLYTQGWLRSGETVVLYITGSGAKYV